MDRSSCVALVVGILLATSSAANPPFFDEIMSQCSFESRGAVDDCFSKLLEGVRPHLTDVLLSGIGVEEWSLPPMEPLKIKAIWFKQGGVNTRLKGEFYDLLVHGLTKYTVTFIKAEPSENKVSVGLEFPALDVIGQYNVSGSVLLVPIKGHGPFSANLTSVRADSTNWLEMSRPAGPNGPARLHLYETRTDFHVNDIRLRLQNLFDHDNFLGETVNLFLNENAHLILNEIKPQLGQQVDRVVLRLFEEAVSSMPARYWEDLSNTEAFGAVTPAAINT